MDMVLRRHQSTFRTGIGTTKFFDGIKILDDIADEGHGIGMRVKIAALVQGVGINHRGEVRVLGIEGCLVKFAGLVVDELCEFQNWATVGNLALAVIMHPAALDQFVIDADVIGALVLAFGVNEHLDFET